MLTKMTEADWAVALEVFRVSGGFSFEVRLANDTSGLSLARKMQ